MTLELKNFLRRGGTLKPSKEFLTLGTRSVLLRFITFATCTTQVRGITAKYLFVESGPILRD